MCEIASRERWCWNLVCTTCGHGDFVFGLVQIGRGIFPGSEAWVEPKTARQGDLRHRDEYSSSKRLIRANPESVYLVCASASVPELVETCRFPDYLGFMGVALNYLQEIEFRNRLLTRLWGSELLKLVGPHGHSAERLREMIEDPSKTLRWEFLGNVETDLTLR